MKSDSSRFTFDQRKHFSSVRMQQGRVQVDADWNEQSDIATHRVETEALDVIGPCGAPQHYPAFHIVDAISKLSAEEQALDGNQSLPAAFAAPDFLISAGRYYVDGILCENEKLTSYKNQPDLPRLIAPPLPPVISNQGLYLVYVDVWERLITALDDPSIREIALGGPDTATRKKTVWQVKYWYAGQDTGNCLKRFPDFESLIAPSNGKLSVRSKRPESSTNPCEVSPGAGYTGLENQLYRIEIHEGGPAVNVAGGMFEMTKATKVAKRSDQVKAGGDWTEGSTVEIFSGDDQTSGRLAFVSKVDAPSGRGKKTLTLGGGASKFTREDLRIRGVGAIYKWSRDNGVVVTTIESIIGAEVTVHDLGPDDALGFKEGQWVEIIDDGLELNGLPGQLAQIIKIDAALNLITLDGVATALDATQLSGVNSARHPKLRRWDGVGAVVFNPNLAEDHFLDLENGVQIRFFAGSYKTGDYWTAAARTANADTQSGTIEWPLDAGSQPLAQSPFGIKHHYCRLAMLHWNGEIFDVIQDCRNLFPPLTELTSLFYVCGEGQQVMPELTKPSLFLPLPQQLIVGVANGELPVKNAEVRFHVEVGNGKTLPGVPPGTIHQDDTKTISVLTDDNGLARCTWQLDSITQSQQVRASLQTVADLIDGPSDKPTHIPIIFTANLSVASEVAYNPGDCASLEKATTVQKALDRLSHLISLYKVKGDNQEVVPGEALRPLVVMVANRCGAVLDQGVHVLFKVISGGGKVNGQDQVNIATDATGQASCVWVPGSTVSNQEVEVSLVSDAIHTPAEPTKVLFTSTLSLASHVYYDSSKCEGLKGQNVNNVQDAIDHLCEVHQGGCCDVTVGIGGQYERLDEAIDQLFKDRRSDICICLLPGEHHLPNGLLIANRGEIEGPIHVKIAGCGLATRIIMGDATSPTDPVLIRVTAVASFTLRDVAITTINNSKLIDCFEVGRVVIENCYLYAQNNVVGTSVRPSLLTIRAASFISLSGSELTSWLIPPPPTFELLKVRQPIIYSAQPQNWIVGELAAALVSAKAAQRQAFLKPYQEFMQAGDNIRVTERTAMEEATKSILDFGRQTSGGTTRLEEAVSTLILGNTLILTEGFADTLIENNRFMGRIMLYGDGDRFIQRDWREFAKRIATNNVMLVAPQATLRIRNNSLTGVSIDRRIIPPQGGETLSNLYGTCLFAENWCYTSDYQLLASHMNVSSNNFNYGDETPVEAGTVAGRSALIFGNSAPNAKSLLFYGAITGQGLINYLDVRPLP